MADIQALADRMVAAVKSHLAHALDPLASRISALEFKAGALALSLARDPAQRAQLVDDERLLQRIQALEDRPAPPELLARLDESAATIESLERRLSQHGERLAQLESPRLE